MPEGASTVSGQMQVYSSSPLNKLMPKGNPLSIVIVEEAEGRFMIRTYAMAKLSANQ